MFKSKQNGSIPALSMNTQEEKKQQASLKNYSFSLQKKKRKNCYIL